MLRLDSAVDFDAIDGAPVDLLFVLLVPEAATDEHLELLRQGKADLGFVQGGTADIGYDDEESITSLGSLFVEPLWLFYREDAARRQNKAATITTLAELKGEGKILCYGISGKTVEGGLLALEQGDCAMVTYNLSEQGEKPVLDYAASHAKGILIKKALASGHACLAEGVDPVRASFELIFAHPGVSSAIVGTITPAHLAANVATVAAVLQGVR